MSKKINWERIRPDIKEPDYSKAALPPAWYKMRSKYGGKCVHCGKDIAPGEWIKWRKGFGAKHIGCRPDPNSEIM